MSRRHLFPILIAAMAVATAAVAADGDMPANVKTVEGEVLMLSPAVLQLGTDRGEIQEFEVTAESEINDRVTPGDRVTVWYREVGGSKTVVTTGAAPSSGSANEQPAASGRESPGMTASQARSDQTAGTTSGGRQGSSGDAEETWYDKEGTPYPEAMDPPADAIVGSQRPMRLPDTASAAPTIALLGVAALAAATAVSMLRRRI